MATAQYSLMPNLKNEYDPAKPNDYEEVLRQRQVQKEAAEKEADRQQHLKREQEVRSLLAACQTLPGPAIGDLMHRRPLLAACQTVPGPAIGDLMHCRQGGTPRFPKVVCLGTSGRMIDLLERYEFEEVPHGRPQG